MPPLDRTRASWSPISIAVALAGGLVAACGSTDPRPIRPEFDLHSSDASRRTQAVAQTNSTRDTSQVPALINLLDDDDAAARLAAGKALRDLTGHDTGYRAYAPPAERARQMEIWRAYWAAKNGNAAPARTSAPPAPAAGGPHVGRS